MGRSRAGPEVRALKPGVSYLLPASGLGALRDHIQRVGIALYPQAATRPCQASA